MQNQVLAGVNIVSKTLGNTTTYYLNNKAIGTYRTKKWKMVLLKSKPVTTVANIQ